jgi:hypothetical protein
MPRVTATPADFAMCRTLGHAWDQIPAEQLPARGGDPFWIRCVRCSTERHDAVDWGTGELIGRQYVYADGYLHAFDDDFDVVPTRQDYRRMLLQEHLMRVRHLRAVRAAS